MNHLLIGKYHNFPKIKAHSHNNICSHLCSLQSRRQFIAQVCCLSPSRLYIVCVYNVQVYLLMIASYSCDRFSFFCCHIDSCIVNWCWNCPVIESYYALFSNWFSFQYWKLFCEPFSTTPYNLSSVQMTVQCDEILLICLSYTFENNWTNYALHT